MTHILTKKSGDDIIVTVGEDKIPLETEVKYSFFVHINSDMILTDSSNSPVMIDATTRVVDASTRTKAVKVKGNGLANTIIGGAGNDILSGGDDKDTLTFDNITFKTSMASYDKSKYMFTFNVSGGSVILKDFTAKIFHINDETYKLSNSTFKKQ